MGIRVVMRVYLFLLAYLTSNCSLCLLSLSLSSTWYGTRAEKSAVVLKGSGLFTGSTVVVHGRIPVRH